jgi:hypothetical protein
VLNFVMIGLMCNSLGCYWAPVDEKKIFSDQKECAAAASMIKRNSVMYFNAACMVKPN